MSVVVGILVIVLGILASVALHEVGHMVPARRFGVRVSQYMVGFGPTLWSRQRGETQYGFKAIPFGGYVRMVGMYPPGRRGNGVFSAVVADAREASVAEIRPGEEHRAFYNLSAPRKLVVMLGGPAMNLAFAFVLLVIMFCGIGVLVPTTTVASVTDCVTPTSPATATAECTASDPVSPAKAGGLRPGDRVVSFDGKPVDTWQSLSSAIDASPNKTVTMEVLRDGQRVSLVMTPTTVQRQVVTDGVAQVDADGNPITRPGGYLGFGPEATRKHLSPAIAGQGLWQTVSGTAALVVTLPVRVADAVGKTLSGEPRGADSVASVVGIGQIAVDVADSDSPVLARVFMMLNLVAALNVSLFVFNLIPLLPLDGGHVVNGLYEGAKRQIARARGRPRPGPADVARMMPVAYVMFVVLVGVGLLLIAADIVNPVRIS